MLALNRPFLIIPKLILQPTWGGRYIIRSKGWGDIPGYSEVAIGQTYELFSGSKLLTNIDTTKSADFLPELGNPDTDEISNENPLFYRGTDHVTLSEMTAEHKEVIVGPKVWEKYQKMPLLIKLNQARGNSFQLHIKPGTENYRWHPKPETWYYFEDGLVTFGLKPGTDLKAYKQTCEEIANFMQLLSQAVRTSQKTLNEAKKEAKNFIENANPWQFVNRLEVRKGEVVDLSSGGLHHSWEENIEKHPLGNIVYEVQQDVMDPVCTIRAFDQGKMKENGSVREVHIDDYFSYLDSDPVANDPRNAYLQKKGETLIYTQFYNMDELQLTSGREIKMQDSFEHIYVKEGEVSINAQGGSVTVAGGHSAFIPYSVSSYTLDPKVSSIVLRTYISAK